MLLQKLADYSRRPDFEFGPRLYWQAPVRYLIDLTAEGQLLTEVPIDISSRESRSTVRGARRFLPQVERTSGVEPLLLSDKADYVLGFVGKTGKPERVAECHRDFMDLLSRCATDTNEPAVLAVKRFLESDPLAQLKLPADFDPSATISFRVNDQFVIDFPAVQEFWAKEHDPARKGAPEMQCVICGEKRAVLDRLQGSIKGVPGGQTSGTSIISANAGAFESYGLEASLIAPTCADCGERFTKAANELLGSRESRTALAGAAFIYWTREDVGFNFLTYMTDPKPEEVGALIEGFRSGEPLPPTDATRFYATVLSGSGGRAVVRDWIDSTVGEVKEKLVRWFQRQAVVDAYGEEPRPLGLAALAGATVRQLSDVPKPTTRSLLHAALTGTPLPQDLLFQAVRRNRAEQTVTRPRAALIKLALCSQPENSDWEESMIRLDQDNDNAAYRCGRLLAVLEQAQRQAIGPQINATIVDRYFGTASSAPAAVFPRLVRGAMPRISKLERDNRPAAIALQRRLEEILGGLEVKKIGAFYTGFPSTLTLQDQGLFSLGYYHQRAHDRAQAAEAAERRRAAQTTDPSSANDDNN
jgi:CRISPR-associated protein Csd1